MEDYATTFQKTSEKSDIELDVHRCQDAGETGDLVQRAGPVIRRRLVSLWVKYKRATGLDRKTVSLHELSVKESHLFCKN